MTMDLVCLSAAHTSRLCFNTGHAYSRGKYTLDTEHDPESDYYIYTYTYTTRILDLIRGSGNEVDIFRLWRLK